MNFLIQADFLTGPARVELARECLWNEWLAKEIYKLIIEKCISVFIKNEKWRFNFVEVLYSPWGGHQLFENNIKAPLRAYLEKESCLIASDNSIIKPEEAIIIDSEIKELIDESDLHQLYPDKKPLHPECKLPQDIERLIKKGPSYNASSGINDEMRRLLELKAKQKDLEFFKKFYLKLSEYAESTLRDSAFRYQNIILTDSWDLVSPNTVYVKPPTLLIPEEIKDAFKIVHQDLSFNQTITETLRLIGVKELTQEHIQDVLRTKEIPKIGKEWESLSDDEKIEKIKLCFELWKKGQIDARDLGFLTLKAKSRRWLPPQEVVLPEAYSPDYKLETLINKKLLDMPIEFVSDEFLQNENDEEIREWRKFFENLGVGQIIENQKDKIVQRIGILTALKYEREKCKRDANELGESEKKGYDIESKSESEERYIEVKSSSRYSPDIFITSNELNTLQEKQDKYYIYVVKDALRNPTLCVTRGNRLLKITEIKTIIPFNKWWENAKEEEYQP